MTRLQSAESNILQEFIEEDVFSEVRGIVASKLPRIKSRGGFSGAVFDSRSLQNLIDRIDDAVDEGYGSALKVTRSKLKEIADHEVQFQIKTAKSAVSGLKLDNPRNKDIAAVVSNRPVYGRTLDNHFEVLARSTKQSIRDRLNIGLLEGKDVSEVLKDLDQYSFGRSAQQADAVARTLVSHASNHAREAVWDANSSEVIGVIYIATLDSATTIVCASLDGKVFKPDQGPRPPQHYGCRSSTGPVFADGGPTPKKLKFADWLEDQSEEVQNESLGVTRAKWFRSGKVNISQLVDQSNRPLTINEIRKHEGLSD